MKQGVVDSDRATALSGGRDKAAWEREHVLADRERALAEDPPHVRGMAKVLRKNIASGEEELVFKLLMQFLCKRRGRFRYSVQETRRVAELYGGKEKLIADLQALLSTVHKILIPQLKRRLNGDQPLPADMERLREAEETLELSQNVNQLLKDVAEDLFGVTVAKMLDEVLGTAKRFYQKQAEELADDGHWFLAGMLATMSDLAIPGSSLEAALSVVPFGRAGGLTRIVIDRAARKAMREMAEKAGKQVTKEVLRREATRQTAAIQTALAKRSHPTVNELAELAAQRHTDDLDDILQVINKSVGDLTPPVVQDFRQAVLRSGSRPHGNIALNELIQVADSRRILADYEILGDGRVIQFIRTRIRRRPGGRGSQASKTARQEGQTLSTEGLDAELVESKRDWGHIVPDVLSGEDKLYNLVLMDARFNRSIYKKIDQLADAPGAEGLEVSFYVEFQSVEHAKKRIAEGLVVDLPAVGGVDPRFLVLGNPLNRPSHTFAEVIKSLENFMRRSAKKARKKKNKQAVRGETPSAE